MNTTLKQRLAQIGSSHITEVSPGNSVIIHILDTLRKKRIRVSKDFPLSVCFGFTEEDKQLKLG